MCVSSATFEKSKVRVKKKQPMNKNLNNGQCPPIHLHTITINYYDTPNIYLDLLCHIELLQINIVTVNYSTFNL